MTPWENISRFAKRFYDIVESPDHMNVYWEKGGTVVAIKKVEEFSKKSLPYICRTPYYSAFTRQLNIYGFKKLKDADADVHLYYHPYFMEGRKDLLEYVRRDDKKTALKKNIQNEIDHLNNSYYVVSNIISNMQNEQIHMKNEVYKISERLGTLELKMQKLLEMLFHFLQEQKGPYKPRSQELQKTKKITRIQEKKIPALIKQQESECIADEREEVYRELEAVLNSQPDGEKN